MNPTPKIRGAWDENFSLWPMEKSGGWVHQKGYVEMRVGGRKRLVHIVIWEVHNGPVPDGYEVHHQNHDRADNRIENLVLMEVSAHKAYHNRRRARR